MSAIFNPTVTRILSATAVAFCLSLSASASVLVADYNFANSGSLGADVSGNGNNASVSGTVTQGTGPLGLKSAVYTSSGVIEDLTNLTFGANTFDPSQGFSYSVWVNIPGWNPYNGFISQDGGGCCFNRLMSNQGNGDVFLNVGNHNDTVVSGSQIPLNTWTLVTLTVDNSGANAIANVYLNGSAVSGNPVSFGTVTDPSTLHTYIGSGEGGGTWQMTGQLADARIYQGVLSASDVSALFASYSSVGTPEPGTWMLLVAGLAGLGWRRLRRRV
jgi:hypothetical protein